MSSFIKFNVIEILKYEMPMKLNHIKDPPIVNYFVIGGKGKFYDPIRVSESYERKREDFPQRKRNSREHQGRREKCQGRREKRMSKVTTQEKVKAE